MWFDAYKFCTAVPFKGWLEWWYIVTMHCWDNTSNRYTEIIVISGVYLSLYFQPNINKFHKFQPNIFIITSIACTQDDILICSPILCYFCFVKIIRVVSITADYTAYSIAPRIVDTVAKAQSNQELLQNWNHSNSVHSFLNSLNDKTGLSI